MKAPTKKDVKKLVEEGVAETKKAVVAAKKLTKETVRSIKKNTPTKQEVHSASRTAARTVIVDAVAAKKGATKFAKEVVAYSKEIAAGVKEGIKDAKKKKK